MLLDSILAHLVADPGLRRHRNRAIGPDFDARFRDVLCEIAFAVGHVTWKDELWQRRQVDIVSTPYAAFEHSTTPYRRIE